MSKIKQNIKKTIKSNLNQPTTPKKTTPVLSTVQKEELIRKQQIVKNMQEYRDTPFSQNQVSKQDRALLAGLPEFGNMDDREKRIQEYRAAIENLKTGGYVRNKNVDYEMIICISSFNRFDKLEKLLSQFYGQYTNYSFKIILLNDGSTDPNYATLTKKYPKLEYHVNPENNGRKLYWYSVTQLWQAAKHYSSNMLMMIDDDFILGNNFINSVSSLFFHLKENNNSVVVIAPHLHSYNVNVLFMTWWYNTHSCDGIAIIDRNFIEGFDHRLQPVSQEQLDAIKHAHVWSQISDRIIEEGKISYKTKVSIAFHDGNDESKMGKDNPRKSKAHTQHYKAFIRDYRDLIV